MAELIFIGRSDDNSSLIFSDEEGNEFSARIDDQLVSSLSTNSPVIDINSRALGVSPRDIQARLRRGETISDIAHEANESIARIERYAGPVFAERHHMAMRATECMVRRPHGDSKLSDLVENVLSRHNVDIDDIDWDSYKREDSRWNITLRWPSGDGSGFAVWIFDPLSQTIVALDDQARWLFEDGATPAMVAQPDSRPRLVSVSAAPTPAGKHIGTVRSFDPDEFANDSSVSGNDLEFDELDSPAWAGPGQPTIPVYLPADEATSYLDSSSTEPGPSWDEILFGSRHNDN